jgi:hypothetical protein
MISKEQFEQVQDILNRSGKQHPKRHVFAFTGLMRCGECGAMITAETKSKKLKNGGTNFYTYYRCTKRLGPCTQKCLEEKVLTEQIQTILSSIEIPHSFCYWALDILKKENEKEGEHSLQRIEQIQREYRGVTKKLSGLIDMRAEGEISAEEFVSKKHTLVTEKTKLEELMRDRGQNVGAGNHERVQDVLKSALYYGAGAALVCSVGAFVLAPLIVGVFTSDPLVTAYALSYFRIVPLGYVFFATAFIEANVFQGIGRSWPGFWITLGRVGIAVAITYTVTSVFSLPIWSVWLAVVAGSIVASVIGFVWVRRALAYAQPNSAPAEYIIQGEEILPPPIG